MSPADPQPEYRTLAPEELAALIDGEVKDMNRIAQLKDMLRGDTRLSGEYDAQRQVKLLLAELPEAEAPAFMATRIMGEIAGRRRERHRLWLPKWGAAAAAVAVFGLGYGAALQIAGQQAAQVAPQFADAGTTVNPMTTAPGLQASDISHPDAAPAFLASDTHQDAFQTIYSDSNSVTVPADTEPWLKEFIQLGNEAHNYSRAMRLTHNLVSPDMGQAVMVVDSH